MQPDRSRRQVPEMPEREEMTSTSSTELQLVSPQREEDRQQEDRPFLFQLNLFYFQKVNILFDSNKTLNLHLIASHVNSPALLDYILTIRNPQTAFDLTIYSLFFASVKKTLNIKKSVCFGTFSRPETLGLHLILPFSYHLHSMMSTTANIEDLLAALSNYSPIDFSAVNLRQISQNILGLKDSFEKLIDCDKIELFNRVIKLVSNVENELNIDAVCAGRHMKSLQECSNEKQCASAVVFLKDGKCEIFAEVYPHYRNKKSKNSDSPSTEVTKHSEEILIGQIDEYLQSNGIHVQSILFYTLNSPCLKREKHTDPCMFKLVEMAHQWQSKFGFSTVVAFTKFWGLSGPNFLRISRIPTSQVPAVIFIHILKHARQSPSN
ncbi:uncharacterized protein LOC122880727 [Siniperca chuatsi]|uniref:uncharacterized protein LOC122880727 n=1 Tax=Siniperca chuatsi TaxID=119488 RepID=UPI001CE19887|nr:uncharacterized protein LOC122880727 [Siniperca chuatsi]